MALSRVEDTFVGQWFIKLFDISQLSKIVKGELKYIIKEGARDFARENIRTAKRGFQHLSGSGCEVLCMNIFVMWHIKIALWQNF